MSNIFKTLAIIGAFTLGSAAFAQDAATETDATSDLSVGVVVEDPEYTLSEHGDWKILCARTEDPMDPCQMYQLLQNEEGADIIEFSMWPLTPSEGQQILAGATVITPLETLLPPQLTMQVSEDNGKRFPYSFCAQIGCVVRLGFVAEDIEALKRSNVATIGIVPSIAPDQIVRVTLSLTGFTAAYDAAVARQAEVAAHVLETQN